MGRLGGCEAGYGSDADVMFVYESRDPDLTRRSRRANWHTTIAERMRSAALGTDVDRPAAGCRRDLRPEGRNGPLVRSLASYAVLRALVIGLGGAGAAARPVRGRRRGSGRAVHRADRSGALPGRRTQRRGSRRDPAAQGPHRHRAAAARRRSRNAHQARTGRPGRHRVDGAAAAAGARTGDCRAAYAPAPWTRFGAARDAGLLDQRTPTRSPSAWRLATRARNAIMLVRDQGRRPAALARASPWSPSAGRSATRPDSTPASSSTTTAGWPAAPARVVERSSIARASSFGRGRSRPRVNGAGT